MTTLNKFVQFNQNYLFNPIIDPNVGMNKTVFVEVFQHPEEYLDDVEEAAKAILERLGYDLDELAVVDMRSETNYRAWDLIDYVDIFKVMEYGKDYSLILLDGTIKNY